MSDRLPLALDAMGGDHAPLECVQGGVDYARRTGRRVLLVGPEDVVRRTLSRTWTNGADVEIVPASQVIGFEDKLTAIRSKRDSSIHVGARLVRDGLASGFVSAGHTGAMMAMCKVIMGVIAGVDRPALPAPLPRRGGGKTVLVDAGANLECKPEHFRQFAVMGYHYSRWLCGIAEPRVALLSVGEEDSKGGEALQTVSRILRQADINFIGNVEGTDLYSGRCDVVVCDGFVGNIALKVSEGLGEAIVELLREGVRQGALRRLGALAMRPVFRTLKKRMDYAEYGGVPLLGLRRVAVVAHGRSHAKAIRNALHQAEIAVDSGMVEKIAAQIERLHEAEQQIL
ncbi:MAG: phosphate acyltransferase PlsX [Acidobacteriota bacterium]|nr:phosphate acyltransferase PlsX [Acidobacteriota bacterium]